MMKEAKTELRPLKSLASPYKTNIFHLLSSEEKLRARFQKLLPRGHYAVPPCRPAFRPVQLKGLESRKAELQGLQGEAKTIEASTIECLFRTVPLSFASVRETRLTLGFFDQITIPSFPFLPVITLRSFACLCSRHWRMRRCFQSPPNQGSDLDHRKKSARSSGSLATTKHQGRH